MNKSEDSINNEEYLEDFISQKRDILYNQVDELIEKFEVENNCWLMVDYSEDKRFTLIPFISKGSTKTKSDIFLEIRHNLHQRLFASWLQDTKPKVYKHPVVSH